MLDISPVLLLSSGITFLLALAFLNTSLYKPLMKHMDDRSASIAKDLENAKSNGSEVEDMLAEAKHIIAEAKRTASSIREEASTQAQQLASEQLTQAKSELNNKYDEFLKNLATEKESLKSSLISSLPLFKESLNAKISSI